MRTLGYLLIPVILVKGILVATAPVESDRGGSAPETRVLPAETLNLPAPRVRAAPAPRAEATAPERPEAEREERMAALAMERFLAIADLPGARELALDVKAALEDDPNAFDFRSLTEGPEHELRPDYLERMIPDPVLREKWTRLMAIVLENGSGG